MDKFEQWFINQDFYTNMRFIHGDALFIKDGDVYRVLPVQMTWVAWQSRQAEVDLLQQYNDDLAGGQCCLYRDLKGKDKLIKELKDSVATYKIETYESHGRISYAHHCFMNMDRDQFYKNIEAVICGRLRHPEFSFDRSRIKALRGDHE